MFALYLLLSSLVFSSALAASADQWRGRSIYQIITDRYALPAGQNLNACDPGNQTWCGGTWNTIQQNLDYIQNAGFTAIWISPVNKNYEGPRSAYGDAYHGYWISDISQLNPRFGTADDLKSLSAELHRRNMYLMVDVVLNNVMSTTVNLTQTQLSTYYFKEPSQYHPFCGVNWNNLTSEQQCWLGDTSVALPDLNTENQDVVSGYASWIQAFVQEYSIDGLRIDAAKHISADFWNTVAAKSGVFCMGEVLDQDVVVPSSYQGPLDSVLNYPLYFALKDAFALPGPANISALVDIMDRSKAAYKDTTVLGNFLENQDQPRWHNMSIDPQSMYNALTFSFMYDGIPIVYYGQEQLFSGNADPWNREPLWTAGYARTPAYQLIATINQFRNFLVANTSWATSNAQILSTTPTGISILKGDVISIMTNIGSPPSNTSVPVYTPWSTETATTDIISCTQFAVGSNGTVQVQYSKGGQPVVLTPSDNLKGSGMCGYAAGSVKAGTSANGAPARYSHSSLFSFWLLILSASLFCSGVVLP